MEGIVDCVNTNSGDDNVVIVSGTIQGMAHSEDSEDHGSSSSNSYFQMGDRFLTAVYGSSQVGRDDDDNSIQQKDEIGEISNLGPAQTVALEEGGADGIIDNSDCLYFTAADFDLRPVASGHLTVHK